MAKVRIHVLAKELEVQSKDILDFLAEKNIEAKTASNSVEEDIAEMIRAYYGKGVPKQEPKAEVKTEAKAEPRAEVKTEVKPGPKEEAKPVDAKPERPKKKSSITAVFNPQNSKLGGGRRPKGQRPGNGRPEGQRGQRPPQHRPEQPMRSASERAEATRAKFDKILSSDKPTVTKQEVERMVLVVRKLIVERVRY